MEANNSLVYVHARPDSSSVHGIFYVGKGSKARSFRLNKRNAYHTNIINKHGKDSILIGAFQCSNEDTAFDLERGLIKCLRRSGVRLANMTDGGEGFTGGRHTEVSKSLISLASKSHAHEIGLCNTLKFKGIPKSSEQRAKMSASAIGRVLDQATRLKISLGHLGKTTSESTKLSMSLAHTGKKMYAKNGVRKWIKPADIEASINEGWTKCRKTNEGAR